MANKNISTIGKIAKDIYKKLGSGHPEVIYDRAMQVGLRLAGIKYESQKVVELTYKNHYVGEGYPDLVAHFGKKRIAIELKATGSKLGVPEETQLRNYMELLGIKEGLLINFEQPGKNTDKTEIEIREVR